MPMVALAFLRVRRQGRLSCGRRSGGARGDHPPVTPTLTNPWHWVTSADGVRIGLLTAGVRAGAAAGARRHGHYPELAAYVGCADNRAAAGNRHGPARPWLEWRRRQIMS